MKSASLQTIVVLALTPAAAVTGQNPLDITTLAGKANPFGSSSTTYNYYWVDCQGLSLKVASGVPGGSEHQYKFQGPCQHQLRSSSTKTTTVFGVTTSANNDVSAKNLGQGWVEAGAEFEVGSGSYSARIKVTANGTSAELKELYKCNADPVIQTATCVLQAFAAEPGLFEGYFNVATATKQPLLYKAATAAQAAALTPPPPQAKAAAAALDAMANSILITNPVAGGTVSGNFMVQVQVGAAVVKSITVNGILVRQVVLEWQAAPEASRTRRLQLPDPWTSQPIQATVAWAGASGAGNLARATISAGQLSGFPRWRVRAAIPGSSVAPSPWVEFQVLSRIR